MTTMINSDGTYSLKFLQYHIENPRIFELFELFAKQARSAGHRHYSARGIFHRIRWHVDVDTRDQDGFKVNNNYSKEYSLMLVQHDPSFEGFFRMRDKSPHIT